jgi:hypothetical protein
MLVLQITDAQFSEIKLGVAGQVRLPAFPL